jgi:ABC-type antimicrobial peptide transport system ATPase subunit
VSLLEVEGLRIRLPTTRGLVTVVDGVDYAVEEGEVFGPQQPVGISPSDATGRESRLLASRRRSNA